MYVATTRKALLILVFLVAMVLLCGSALAADSTAAANDKALAFGFLAKWDGKDPIWVWDAKVKALLKKTLGDRRTKQLISNWGSGSSGANIPVDRFDDQISFFDCKHHFCASFNTTIFISMKDGSVQACWVDSDAKFNTTEVWLSPKGERKLSEGACCTNNKDIAVFFKQYGEK